MCLLRLLSHCHLSSPSQEANPRLLNPFPSTSSSLPRTRGASLENIRKVQICYHQSQDGALSSLNLAVCYRPTPKSTPVPMPLPSYMHVRLCAQAKIWLFRRTTTRRPLVKPVLYRKIRRIHRDLRPLRRRSHKTEQTEGDLGMEFIQKLAKRDIAKMCRDCFSRMLRVEFLHQHAKGAVCILAKSGGIL